MTPEDRRISEEYRNRLAARVERAAREIRSVGEAVTHAYGPMTSQGVAATQSAVWLARLRDGLRADTPRPLDLSGLFLLGADDEESKP